MIKKSNGEKIFSVFNILAMVVLMILCIYPLLYVIFASFSDPTRLAAHRGLLLSPLGFTIKGYELVRKNSSIASGYVNTLIYLTAGTALNLVMTSIGAYVLSRKNSYWAEKLMFMIVITMFFSGGLIPLYILVKSLGMVNTVWAIILPGAISTWNLIIMRTSFMSIPSSLEESAHIDGAGDFTILLRIIIPLSMPVIAVMILFYSVGHWNSWFSAMMYLRKRNMYPLQLILREILIQNTDTTFLATDVSSEDDNIYRSLVQYCTIVVATVPILFVYPFLQKYFIKGVMIGAIKG